MVNQKLAANPLRTKSDLAEALFEILEPLEKYMDGSKYGLKFGGGGSVYEEKIREIEALLRPLWGIAPLVAGGGEYPFAGRYFKKIAKGTDRNSQSYWGDTTHHNRYDMSGKYVIMSSVLGVRVFILNVNALQKKYKETKK